MQMRQPRYSKEEHARRGNEIYTQHVRPQVEASNQGKIVAIDVETGAFEMAEDTLTAAQRLALPPSRGPDLVCSDRLPWGPSFWPLPYASRYPMITGMVNANREAIIHLMTLGLQDINRRLRRLLIPALPVFD